MDDFDSHNEKFVNNERHGMIIADSPIDSNYEDDADSKLNFIEEFEDL